MLSETMFHYSNPIFWFLISKIFRKHSRVTSLASFVAVDSKIRCDSNVEGDLLNWREAWGTWFDALAQFNCSICWWIKVSICLISPIFDSRCSTRGSLLRCSDTILSEATISNGTPCLTDCVWAFWTQWLQWRSRISANWVPRTEQNAEGGLPINLEELINKVDKLQIKIKIEREEEKLHEYLFCLPALQSSHSPISTHSNSTQNNKNR